MSTLRIFGLVLLAVGLTLALFGFNASQKIGEQMYEGAVGRFSPATMKYLLSGVALTVGGAAVYFSKSDN